MLINLAGGGGGSFWGTKEQLAQGANCGNKLSVRSGGAPQGGGAGGQPPPPPPPNLSIGGASPPNFRLQYKGVPKSPLFNCLYSVTVYTG